MREKSHGKIELIVKTEQTCTKDPSDWRSLPRVHHVPIDKEDLDACNQVKSQRPGVNEGQGHLTDFAICCSADAIVPGSFLQGFVCDRNKTR